MQEAISQKILMVTACLLCTLSTFAQGRMPDARTEEIEFELARAAQANKALDRGVDISFTGALRDFAVVFSKETGVNLIVDPRLTQEVAVNFTATRPRDILLYLVEFYELELSANASLVTLSPSRPSPVAYVPKAPQVGFDASTQRYTLELERDTLDYVVAALTGLGDTAVLAGVNAGYREVSGFVRGRTLYATLVQLATRNGLEVRFDEPAEAYVLNVVSANEALTTGNPDVANSASSSRGRTRRSTRSSRVGKPEGNSRTASRGGSGTVSLVPDSSGRQSLVVNVNGQSLETVVRQAADASGVSYLSLDPLEGEVSLSAEGLTFYELLERILPMHGFSFRENKGLTLIGLLENKQLRQSEVITLMHRSVKDLVATLPSDVTEGLEVSEFLQLNALVCAGQSESITRLKTFLHSIDKSVPVVMIELLIVDVQKNAELTTGIEVGRADEPVQTAGKIFPEVDLALGAKSLNSLLDLLAGNGVINLGSVDPNFYARIQAAESNGFARVHSKPRLSTINGQEASLSLGETRYFSVQRTTLTGNQNPVTLQDRTFESVNADFTIRILPMVSGDGGVTLEIDVSQSDFLGRLQNDAPPAQVSREFTSLIRVADGDMIVLGGLESKTVNDAGTGVPFLSRVPVLKWLFSSRSKSRNSSRLLVFVRPLVIY